MPIKFIKNHWENTVAVRFEFLNGAKVEKENEIGFLHFAEHLVLSGTKNYDEQSLAKKVDDVFNLFHATTSLDRVSFNFSFDILDLEKALTLFLQMMDFSISKQAFLSQKQNIIEETKEYFEGFGAFVRTEISELLKIKRLHGLAPVSVLKKLDYRSYPKIKNFWEKFISETESSFFVFGNVSNKEKHFIESSFNNFLGKTLESSEVFKVKNKEIGSLKSFNAGKFVYKQGKEIAFLSYKSDYQHVFNILFDYLLFLRCQREKKKFFRMYSRIEGYSVFSVWAQRKADFKKFSKILCEKPNEEEFLLAKDYLKKEFHQIFDFSPGIFESMEFLSDFENKNFFPFLENSKAYYDFILKTGFNDFISWWEERRGI
jgi:hypothetical protein